MTLLKSWWWSLLTPKTILWLDFSSHLTIIELCTLTQKRYKRPIMRSYTRLGRSFPPFLQNCINAQDKAKFVRGLSFWYKWYDNNNAIFEITRRFYGLEASNLWSELEVWSCSAVKPKYLTDRCVRGEKMIDSGNDRSIFNRESYSKQVTDDRRHCNEYKKHWYVYSSSFFDNPDMAKTD